MGRGYGSRLVPSRKDCFINRRRLTNVVLAIFLCTFAPAATAAGNATSATSSSKGRTATARSSWPTALRTSLTLTQTVDHQAPRTPTGLAITAVSTTSITLTWTASRDNVGVAGYGVYVNGARVASTTLRSYKPSSLTCGTTYKLGVDAYDAARNRSSVVSVLAATSPCLDATAPTAPANVHQSSWSQNGAGVEWSGATDNVGVAGYSIYRDGVPIATTQQSAAWVPNLVCGAGYSVSVEAFDAAGNHSPRTAAVVNTTSCADTTAPSAPRNLSVSGSTSSTISVAWEASSDDRGVAEYRASLEGLDLRTTTGTNTSFSGLACGRSYLVKVVAADAAGNLSPSASVSASTSPCASSSADTQPPTMPTGLLRRDATATSVTLSWNASSDNVGVAGYGIYRAGTKVADANVTAYEVQGLACATSYTFAVDAVDVNGLRSARATVIAMTEPCPGTTAPSAPTNLASQSRTETSITLSWQASTGGSGYRVYRDGLLAGSTATTSYTVTGLTCGKSYTLGVEAYDAAGSHSTRPATILSTAACSDAVAPSSPTSLTKAGSTTTSISLNWTAASDNIAVAGYSLYVGGTAIGTTAQTSYAFPSLACGTSYLLG